MMVMVMKMAMMMVEMVMVVMMMMMMMMMMFGDNKGVLPSTCPKHGWHFFPCSALMMGLTFFDDADAG